MGILKDMAELDAAVARAEGYDIIDLQPEGISPSVGRTGAGDMRQYSPTSDDSEAMALLIKYKLTLTPYTRLGGNVSWEASNTNGRDKITGSGLTPCVAICQAVANIYKYRTS